MSYLFAALCTPEEEYLLITRYLAIPPTPRELFTPEIVQILVNKCQDKQLLLRGTHGRTPNLAIEYPLKVNTLMSLPSDYTELINSASQFM